jgi:hypothetical protein
MILLSTILPNLLCVSAPLRDYFCRRRSHEARRRIPEKMILPSIILTTHRAIGQPLAALKKFKITLALQCCILDYILTVDFKNFCFNLRKSPRKSSQQIICPRS